MRIRLHRTPTENTAILATVVHIRSMTPIGAGRNR